MGQLVLSQYERDLQTFAKALPHFVLYSSATHILNLYNIDRFFLRELCIEYSLDELTQQPNLTLRPIYKPSDSIQACVWTCRCVVFSIT